MAAKKKTPSPKAAKPPTPKPKPKPKTAAPKTQARAAARSTADIVLADLKASGPSTPYEISARTKLPLGVVADDLIFLIAVGKVRQVPGDSTRFEAVP
jgi:hypothetical protein